MTPFAAFDKTKGSISSITGGGRASGRGGNRPPEVLLHKAKRVVVVGIGGVWGKIGWGGLEPCFDVGGGREITTSWFCE